MLLAGIFQVLFLLSIAYKACSQSPIKDNMNSFSNAQKNGHCVLDIELVLFERNGAPGVITEQWFTGYDCFKGDSIIRYYIDGENSPTIEGQLYMLHGIGFYDARHATPWGHKWLGHLAGQGGLYNTIRIPYQHSIMVTLEAKTRVSNTMFWYIIRGVENYPIWIGDLTLPPTARLRLQKIEHKEYDILDYVTLASSKKKGLLFMVTLAGESSDFNYLEGCFRMCASNNSAVEYLSSGTEDFFLSAYYYNLGVYHTEHAGLSYIKGPGTMSAYKIFASDPVMFKGPFSLIWRQSEEQDNACFIRSSGDEVCKFGDDGNLYVKSNRPAKKFSTKVPNQAKTTISSYVLFYEW